MTSLSLRNSTPNNEQLAAFEDLRLLVAIEPAVEHYEQTVKQIQDETTRIHYLIELNMFFYESFGIPHEQRFAYREQLLRVAFGTVPDKTTARTLARDQYAAQFGKGLPLMTALAHGDFSSKEN
ncbi:MAG: hypothetical protein KDB22_21620 [Planctomycetales bacterium]|nr:hypothetical protein [Planctomycetales bacterium]